MIQGIIEGDRLSNFLCSRSFNLVLLLSPSLSEKD
jgi:hypothetical protein